MVVTPGLAFVDYVLQIQSTPIVKTCKQQKYVKYVKQKVMGRLPPKGVSLLVTSHLDPFQARMDPEFLPSFLPPLPTSKGFS